MRLFDIQKDSKIYAECSDGSEYLIFHHLDGMYSYCKTEKGGIMHLLGATPLKQYKDGFTLDTKKIDDK